MVTRRQDVIDILAETDGTPNKGWQTPPNIPAFILEDRHNTSGGFINNPPEDGVMLVRQDMRFEREK